MNYKFKKTEKMKNDNSRYFEEKFNDGYIKAIQEIRKTNLIVIENELYELTTKQLNKFYAIRADGYNQGNWHESLEYIQKNCNLLSYKVSVFNY